MRDFFFLNNLVNLNARYLLEFVEAMEAAQLDIRWVDCARPRGISADMFKRLANIGCRRLTFGVDGGTDRLLAQMRKQLTIAEAEQSIRDAHAAGLSVAVNLIVGMPHETEDDFDSMCAFIDRNMQYVEGFRPMPYVYTVGSPLYNEPHEFGLLRRGATFDVEDSRSWEEHTETRDRRYKHIARMIQGRAWI